MLRGQARTVARRTRLLLASRITVEYSPSGKMLRKSHCTCLSVAGFALVLGAELIASPPVHAQETQSKPEEPGPKEPQEVAGADFAIEAGAVEERLTRIRAQISLIDVVDGVKADLDAILTESTALSDELKGIGTHRATSSELNSLYFRLEALDD
jgi:hypothetical protein